MRPNFALSLSFDGIRLLHRAATGWTVVGEADPHAPTLAEDLAVLRRTATALEPSGLRCKLVLPDEQIRFLSLETPGLDDAERRMAVASTLEGATPYAIADLVFDTCTEKDTTHVAAVAKETLAEAEAFATDHQMHPICFTARPQRTGFVTEPFFGPTNAYTGSNDTGEPIENGPIAAAALEQPGFVSRRRVPTFQTEDSIAAEKPQKVTTSGLSEERAPFEGSARKVAADGSTKSTPAGTAARSQKPRPGSLPPATSDARSRGGFSGIGSAGLLVLVFVALFAGLAAFAGGALSTKFATILELLTKSEKPVQFTDLSPPIDTPIQTPLQTTVQTPEADSRTENLALPEPELTDEDAAVLDALGVPESEPEQVQPPNAPPVAAAPKDIWQAASSLSSPPPLIGLEDLYITSIDPIDPNFDAVALPPLSSERLDRGYLAPASPAPAGTRFELDARAMVVATPGGALNPDGIAIFAGPPPAKPPLNLLKAEDPGVDLSQRLRLAAFRPQSRPGDLIETSERATFSGLTRSELSQMRPRMRPRSAQENALASASLVRLDSDGSQSLLSNETDNGFDEASGRAISASLRPDARPSDFSDTVAEIEAAKPTVVAASATTVAPRAVTPRIPSSASATREATVQNAINLRKVNLIGVYGTPSDRRALVRLGNGSYLKVKVGDRIDGGQVSAIGDAELRYQKSGRAVVLKMPRG